MEPNVKRLVNVGAASLCYRSLLKRNKGFASRDAALDYARSMNFTTDAVWGVVAFENTDTSTRQRYNILVHHELRRKLSTLYLQVC